MPDYCYIIPLTIVFQENFNGWMQKYKQKIKNAPKMEVFPHLWPPRFFVKNRALSLLYPYGALTSCKKLEKTDEWSLRSSKRDRRTDKRTDRHTDRQRRLQRTLWANQGSKMRVVCHVKSGANINIYAERNVTTLQELCPRIHDMPP